ncbi:DegT/DnrJ/EryC1/StrS family aminotransferase [Paenibacillus massiliensis]|uniref:DegT/DnrJ/EryC1/StrS family aminotransferase n=1 Tax=Paenibacillus massiliensis TaxID=225917 RepID=UPI000365230F|nr:DegT/DnrJ/EryC1/StrS family aminotransferase [Paenibacillus massiliensis]
MSKKPIYVSRSSMPPFEEYMNEIRPMWETAWLTNMGAYHNRFEQQLVEYLDVDYISLFTNGHLALELVLQSMNLTGEVITTPFTFASTTHAIVRNGLTPVFCDVNPVDYTMDVSRIESLITDKTSAILPVHVYGNICNVYEIERIAKKYELKVIYDAAHAFGEKIHGQSVGRFGDASMFSFHATKVFHTIEGGAVTFADEGIGKKLYHLKNFGITSEESVEGIGSNAKMNEFQAAMGICNLRHLSEVLEKRKQIVSRYRERLAHVKGIQLIRPVEGVQSNYAYFPVVFHQTTFGFTRNEIYERLKKHQIITRKYFYPLTNTLACYNQRFDVNATPVAQTIAKRVLTLPLYAELAVEDVDRICDIILER